MAQLNIDVPVVQWEQNTGVMLSADELTEVLTHMTPLALHQWGDHLDALIDQRRAKEATARSEAALRAAQVANRWSKWTFVVAVLALLVAVVALLLQVR